MLNEVKTRNIISGLIPPLSAAILLTQKQSEIGTFSEILGIKNMYSASCLVGHILEKVALHLSGQFTEKTQMVRKKTKFKDWRHHFVA